MIFKRKKPTGQEIEEKKMYNKAVELLKEYQDQWADLDQRIIENEEWYRVRHWDYIKKRENKEANGDPEPSTGYLFNMLANKQADLMDNYPIAIPKPKDKDDVGEAETLDDILPLIFKLNKHKKSYSKSSWAKLKSGISCRSILWDSEKSHGIGDVAYSNVDVLSVYFDLGVEEIQKSKGFFVLGLEDREDVVEDYDVEVSANAQDSSITMQKYTYDNTSKDKKVIVIDYYYYTKEGQCHFKKLCDGKVLFDSEEDDKYSENGYYRQYPFVIDRLFDYGQYMDCFGFIDIIKSPQMYIDKIGQLILKNTAYSANKRWGLNKKAMVNRESFLNFENELIEFEGVADMAQAIKEFETKPLPAQIFSHRKEIIQEMKDVTANDVFNSGEGGKGVTAASAIYALQEAGNKLSRSIISMSYESFIEEVEQVIELIRDNYNIPRSFRIDDKTQKSGYRFVDYDNTGLKDKPYADDYNEGQRYRRVEFDIDVKAEKKNPYSSLALNEMASSMFGAGFFNPQRSIEALVALEMMSFDGKDKIKELVTNNGQQFEQMQAQIQKYQAAIQKLTSNPQIAAMLGGEIQ